ncbi:MAG: SGNH/GDSL hydrolase family protein [Bacteroidales bacterium]|nr:SGNH/GDSL hydrolase family protein [Bacteroidales bacterium]
MKQKSLFIVSPIVLAAAIIFALVKIGRHERSQNEMISNLTEEVRVLSHKLNGMTGGVEWPEDSFNYLAIGNSLTVHGVTTFWWNECGMAASKDEKDYFHLVTSGLEKKAGNVYSVRFNFGAWEIQAHDRDETLVSLDKYLSPKIDLVTVQLAENVTNLDTYEKDYVSLLTYLKTYCPKARILVVGDFWSRENRDQLKEQACKECGVEYISLEGIKDNNDYFCGLGTTVYDDDGNPHVVEHGGVAAHPGDTGMEAIADRILKAL